MCLQAMCFNLCLPNCLMLHFIFDSYLILFGRGDPW